MVELKIFNKKINTPPQNNQEPARRKSIYLLPNLLTTGALFAGFYAIVAGIQDKFDYAAIALFVAMIMDTLDGRVARLTGTQSAFGAQYDSLSDMVCFGITPALVSYSWGLSVLGKSGWLAAFVYTASTALRLARFNIQSETSDKYYFIGLPCPAAAAVVAGMVWMGAELNIPGKRISIVVAMITVTVALLMVSNFRYYSFKEIDFKGSIPFIAVLAIVCIFSVIAWNPPVVLFGVFFLYALSGPALWFKHRYWSKKGVQ
jgi:CDP-diacylglycerol--serine O-phosphatidyltransferase